MKKKTEEEKKKDKKLYIILGLVFIAVAGAAINNMFFTEKKGFGMKIAGQEYQYKKEEVFKKGNDISGFSAQSSNSDQPSDPKAKIPEKLRWDGN